MNRVFPRTALFITAAFLLGFLSHLLYQRWSTPASEPRSYPVVFSPPSPPGSKPADIPLIEAREVEKIKALAGSRARVRGRVYRVGHSAKSDTYFINFGPARSSFTGVIFSSALESFQKKNIHPKSYEGKEVELTGEIRDHPKYGLEMILEEPSQIEVLN